MGIKEISFRWATKPPQRGLAKDFIMAWCVLPLRGWPRIRQSWASVRRMRQQRRDDDGRAAT